MRPTKAGTLGTIERGGPLSRELTTVKLFRLVDFMNRAAQLAFPRVSGLSDFQWRVVAWANELAPLSINQLAALLNRDVAQASRAVKGMVAAGLLHRANRKGGPGVLITATPLGKAVYVPLRRLARKRNQQIIHGVSVEDLQVVERCLGVMMKNARTQLAQELRLDAQGPGMRRGRPVGLS